MNINKLAPWNWFTKEHEQEGTSLPVTRRDAGALETPPLWQLHRDIDRLFGDVFRDFPFASGMGRSLASLAPGEWLKPTLDIAAGEREYAVTVELPGVDEKDVHLELEGNTLRIRGEKRQEKEEKQRDFYRVERSYGSFQRVLSLPEDADQGEIAARFGKGILTITIPRKPSAKSEARRIPINA